VGSEGEPLKWHEVIICATSWRQASARGAERRAPPWIGNSVLVSMLAFSAGPAPSLASATSAVTALMGKGIRTISMSLTTQSPRAGHRKTGKEEAMSWYGAHPVLSKADAKALLPVGACKRCVYYFRVHQQRPVCCGRCGQLDEFDGEKQ